MPPNLSDPRWVQFRRLLLGTVIESLLASKVAVDFPTIRISFDSESDFRVPRLDNYMRFKGKLEARLTAPPAPGTEATLARSLQQAWLSLLGALDLPIGDKLTSDRDDVTVRFEAGDTMVLQFDLEAD
jgi:hypothetical protein